MTMKSRVELIDIITRAITEEGRDFDVMQSQLGVPKIVGNFLFYNGKISMLNPTGETLIVTSPIRTDDDEVLVHFGIGTENRRICHNIPIADFEKLVLNMNTILALAKLEEGKD